MGFFPSRRNGNSGDANIVVWLIALILSPLVVPYQIFTKKLVYKNTFGGALARVPGVILGFYFGAIQGAHYVGWADHHFWDAFMPAFMPSGHNWYIFLPMAGIWWWCWYAYFWPLVFFVTEHTAWKALDHIFKFVRDFAEKRWQKLSRDIVSVLTANPLSRPLWVTLLDDSKRNWARDLVDYIAYGIVLAGAVYLGWLTYEGVQETIINFAGILGLGTLAGKMVAGVAALFVLPLVAGLGFAFVRSGKLPGVALMAGVPAAWAALTYGQVIGIDSYNAVGKAIVSLAAYWAEVAIIFPTAVLMFSNGFWEQLWKKYIYPLGSKFYEDRDEEYGKFFHHIVNIAAACGVCLYTSSVCSALAMSPQLALATTAIITWSAYYLVYQVIKEDGGNFIIGAIASTWLAWEVAIRYVHAGWFGGVYGGFVIAFITASAVGIIALPAVYWGLRSVLKTLRISLFGIVLDGFYKVTDTVFGTARKGLEKLCRKTYERDDTGFKEGFLHVANIAITGGAFYVVTHYALLGFMSPISGLVVLSLGTALCYLILGRILTKTGQGMIALALILGGVAATSAGVSIYALSPAFEVKVAAIAAGVLNWSAVDFVLLPIGYALVETLLGWLPLAWLGSIYNFFWSFFDGFWSALWAVLGVIGEIVAQIARQIARIWSR